MGGGILCCRLPIFPLEPMEKEEEKSALLQPSVLPTNGTGRDREVKAGRAVACMGRRKKD
jgi:hypothetical protein